MQSEKLDKLRIDRQTVFDQLSEIDDAIRTEKLRLIREKFGVQIGSIVVDRSDKEYRVTEIDLRSFPSKPWLEANPKKKDGTWGIARRNLYSEWKLAGAGDE